jgi:hypothetical protein
MNVSVFEKYVSSQAHLRVGFSFFCWFLWGLPPIMSIRIALTLNADLSDVLNRLDEIMTALTDLQDEVTATNTVEASAVALIQGIAAQLAALLAQSPTPDSALVDLTNQLTASAAALGAAITANTPAAPPPATTPPADTPPTT